jgi:kynurenine formamidase
MLGLDTPTPDQSPFLIHKILLGNEILIIENLTHTEELLEFPNFEIIALPLKIDADGSPARVIAKLY